jgi:Tfp pilus assembly protein PilP
MEIAPRLLSLAVALVLVFANPYVVRTAPQTSAPKPTPPPASSSEGAAAPASAPKATPATPAAPAEPATQAAPATATPPPAAPAAAGPALEPQGYTYHPEGRRDPFTSLLLRGSQLQNPTLGARAAGLSGLETSEVTLKGTIASQGGFVGILQGADTKAYIVRAGDRLLDGTIRTITQDSMVVTQQVTDPLSLEKQREVRKVLRQTEEAK